MPPKSMNNQTLDFISDWQHRSSKQQRMFVISLLVAMIVSVIIGDVGFLWFREDNYDRIVNQNMKFILDSALQESIHLEQQLENSVQVIRKYAAQYAAMEERLADTSVPERLELLCNRTLFDRISFISPQGQDISLQGNCYVGDRDYFQRAMAGESGYELLESSRVTHDTTLIFYTPVFSGEEVLGVMAGFYERDRIEHLVTYRVLNYETKTYLLQGDGTVVGSSNDQYIAEDMFALLEQVQYTRETGFSQIMEAIADETRTSITFSFQEEGQTSIGVISQFVNGDWMILSVLPSEITAAMLQATDRSGQMLLIALTIAFLLLIGIFAAFLVGQRRRMNAEMSLATESLREAILHDRQQSFVAESLGYTYSSIYYVNLAQNSYQRIDEQDPTAQGIPNNGCWGKEFARFISLLVDEPYRKNMHEIFDIECFEQRLGSRELVGMEYQRTDGGWRRAVMIPSERDEENHITTVIFAAQKIDAEKEREMETQQALQEAYEAAQLASRAKTTFLSNMSHDIRTPMNAIVGMTAIAAANLGNPDKVSDCLKKITTASKHLLGLINEVLDMSKIESGKVDLSEDQFSLSDMMDGLISMNQVLIKEKNHTLLVKVNNLLHENVVGDSTRLQQVFTNLLTNAIKYTPPGGRIEIILSEKQTNKPSVGWYEVVFRDNGVGMTPEFAEHIFEPFTRANDSRIATIQGTGLGMAIARNIVRMMNGDITVESQVNQGSSFTVTFALKLQREELDYSRLAELPVLVVDDDEACCESVCTMLSSLSMRSEYVTSGRQAVEKTLLRHAQGEDYYAVIIDWQMPDMNGVETAREIRRRVGSEVPIIVISAYDWTDIEQEARAAGVNAFLGKPLFKSRLTRTFTELLGQEPGKTQQPEPVRARSYGGKRILLAEDNELNSEIAVELLSMLDLQVDTSENGQLCAEKFLRSPPGYYSLIFMDIQMPVMNGYQAAQAIRAGTHPNARTVPIIAMTANAFSTDVRAAFDSGMNGHVSKPIDLTALTKTLDEYL